MGFLASIANGSIPIIRYNGQTGQWGVKDGSPLNGTTLTAKVRMSRGGYLKFDDGKALRKVGPIFPDDEAPERKDCGDDDQSRWPKAKFGDGQEDPWKPVIELPLQSKDDGKEYLLSAMSKTALASMQDFLNEVRKSVPNTHNPVVRLDSGSYKGKFGKVSKPVLSIIGKVADTGEPPFNDSAEF